MKRIADELSLAIAGQLHTFDFQKELSEKSYDELSDLLGVEAVIKRYRNDSLFHAKVCALVSSALGCVKELPQEITQLRSVLSEQEATIKALMSENVEINKLCDQLSDLLTKHMRYSENGNGYVEEALAAWRQWKEKANG